MKRTAVLLAFSLITVRLSGETVRLSIADAIHRALGEGTQAELARSSELRARVGEAEARNALLPQVNAELQRYNQSINLQTFGFTIPGAPAVIPPFDVTDAQVTAAVQLFNLAAIRRYQALRDETRASHLDTEQADNDVAAAIARLYVLVARADAQIASRRSDVDLFDRLRALAADEFKAGTGTRLDIAESEVQLSRARNALLVAQNERETARLALLNAIGANQSDELVLTETLVPPTTQPDLNAALTRASTQRPEIVQAELREREAEENVKAAQARRFPAVSFEFAGDLSGKKATDLLWTRRLAGVVSVPIFRYDIESLNARARIAAHDARTSLEQRRRDVEQDVRRSYLSLQNAASRVAVARDTVRVAEEALQVARDRRSAGYGSSVEVDRAQDQYRQAHEDFIAASADAVAAHFDFEHAVGDIARYVKGNETAGPARGGSTPLNGRTGSDVTISTQPTQPAPTSPPVLTPPDQPVTPPVPGIPPAAPPDSSAPPMQPPALAPVMPSPLNPPPPSPAPMPPPNGNDPGAAAGSPPPSPPGV